MNTDLLIARLSHDLRPVPRGLLHANLRRGLVVGATVASFIVLFWPSLGTRSDLGAATMTSAFWIKLLYTASIASIGFFALESLSRPEAAAFRWTRHLWPPVALLTVITAVRWVVLPSSDATAFWMGSSWWQCPIYVTLLSIPVYFGLVRMLSRLAPTRLGTTGAVAGLVAGATAATIYGLHCVETSPGFVLLWYSLGLAAATSLGAAAGPRLLRW